MANSPNYLLELDFEAGLIDDSSMSVEISTYLQKVFLTQLKADINTVKIECTFPDVLSIIINGKGEFDTQVDDQGNITADKYIKLADMRLNGLRVDENYLPRFITLKPFDKEPVLSNYWGFNGIVEIPLEPTPFQWVAGTKRL